MTKRIYSVRGGRSRVSGKSARLSRKVAPRVGLRRLGFELLEPRQLLSVSLVESKAVKEAVWIEGEDFITSNFNQHGWYQNTNIRKDLLSPGIPGVSDGQWHTHFTNSGSTVTAEYTVEIAQGGEYWWWIRLNPFFNDEGPDYTYSIDSGPWQPIDVSEVADTIDLVDPAIDIRFIGWTFGDFLDLAPGSHSIRIRISDSGQTHGGIDVMALTNFSWAPAGVLPPDPDPPTPQPEDWFPLMAGPDPFSPDSIIDMSYLLEPYAGSHGFLRIDGKDFAFTDGTPVKFWGVGASMGTTLEAQQRQARFYAKHGINMVRQHPVESVLGVLQTDPNNGQRGFDPVKLDRWDRWFSILKDNGIYMTWSLFYPHVITPDDGYPQELYDELPGHGVGKSSSGMVAFMPQLQDAEWEWERRLLEHVNPYTGLAYKDDPALAVVEVHNEDSVFWHSPLTSITNGEYPLHEAILKSLWQQWVKARYGDDATLAAAWAAGMRAGDSVDNPSMKIYGAWEMEADGPWGGRKQVEKQRMGDFIRFLAEMQRDYYLQRQGQLRDLGYQAVTVSTAWLAGGPAASAANLWTDDAMEAIDRHSYFGGGAGGHSVTTGWVDNDTHLDQPGRGILSSGMFQVEDKPFIMTEWTQKPPNQWKAEIAPLMAFYGLGLQGWDASYHFAASRTYLGNGWPGMRSYVTATPHYLGQFPALAYAIYNGHFDEGAIAAARRLDVDDVFQGIDALTQNFPGGGYDQDLPTGNLQTPLETLAIGRVTAKIADAQEPSYADDWDAYWDQQEATVHSNTGQLSWDYTEGQQVVTVHSDKTQGVIGFAGGGTYDLPGVVIEVDTEFVSLLLTPLDNRPLIQSQHILITAMAQDKQYGTVYNADGTELLETGGPPLLLEPVRATLTLKGRPPVSVKAVDVYGVPIDQQIERTGNQFAIDGRYATYYYEVKRDPSAEVVGRHVFYNNSAFDDRDPAANRADDDAVAPDKTALRPGQSPTLANYTSYVRGINGIMVDMADPAGTITAQDFEFRAGNDDTPEDWDPITVTPTVVVRGGEGFDGSDRVTIIFDDNLIQNQWLQVKVLANTSTGLTEDDVFSFGNAIGETGNSADNASVDAYDVLETRSNPRPFFNPAEIDTVHDFNRDGRVDAVDTLIARNHQTWGMTELNLFPQRQQVLITEAGTGTPDSIEIQNVSSGTIDTSGWVVAANNAQNYEINDVHPSLWSLPDSMNPSDLAYRIDTAEDNIFWRDADEGWVLIVDDRGKVVDFVVWGYHESLFPLLSINDINGYSGHPAVEAWTGPAVSSDGAPFYGLQRVGNADHDAAGDWTFDYAESPNLTNEGLLLPFASGGGLGKSFPTNRSQVADAVTRLEAVLADQRSEVEPDAPGAEKTVAHQVAWQQAVDEASAWLYEFHPASGKDRRVREIALVAEAVDMLLTTTP